MADATGLGLTSFERAAFRSMLFCCSLLLCMVVNPVAAVDQKTSEVRRDCGSPLLGAIYKRDMKQIQEIINSRVGLNFKGCPEPTTPLIEAIGEQLYDVAKKLILAGADPNLAADDGTTPLVSASFYCRDELVALLIKKGATVDSIDNEGETALMAAAQNCDGGKIVRMLLGAGAKTDLQTKSRATALTVAAFYGNESAVRQLVAAGADLNAKDDEGTALTIARDRQISRKKSHDRIYEFLRAAANRNR